jgi:hypothetical protein
LLKSGEISVSINLSNGISRLDVPNVELAGQADTRHDISIGGYAFDGRTMTVENERHRFCYYL